jgi:hypothetical protein
MMPNEYCLSVALAKRVKSAFAPATDKRRWTEPPSPKMVMGIVSRNDTGLATTWRIGTPHAAGQTLRGHDGVRCQCHTRLSSTLRLRRPTSHALTFLHAASLCDVRWAAVPVGTAQSLRPVACLSVRTADSTPTRCRQSP